jgi:type II secretory pathway pseudopilin PulG
VRTRSGFTLLDQLLAMSVVAVLLSMGLQQAGALRDRLAVRAAGHAVRDAVALAREHANATGSRTAVRFDRLHSRVAVHRAADTINVVAIGHLHGVTLDATRDSMAYQPSGLGFGSANLSVVLARGHSADTVHISRLGRVR